MDPLAALPPELALKVLKYLPFRNVALAQTVNKSWLNFIRSEKSLWRHLNLFRPKCRVPTSFVDTAINVAGSSITIVTLYGDRMQDHDVAFQKLAHNCPLEKVTLMQTGVVKEDRQLVLTLRDLKHLRELRLGAENSLPITLCSFMLEPHVNNLEVLDLDGYAIRHDNCVSASVWPRVRALRIAARGQQGSGAGGIVGGLHLRFPVLETLEVSNIDRRRFPSERWPWDFTQCSHLRWLSLNLRELKLKALVIPPWITTLRLESENSEALHSSSPDDPFRVYLPQLEHLDLCLPGMTIKDVDKFLDAPSGSDSTAPSGLSNLTYLAINKWDFGEPGIENGASFTHLRLQRLRGLKLQFATGLEEARVRLIVEQLKYLQKLDVCQSDVTDNGVWYAVRNSGVTTMHLRGCQGVTETVVEWVRRKGIKVVR
ncbi:hypothetical protein DOTSEDRAFT_71822 [Dothistroma septosporum NZE10]|uniref:F-box domain-containing protein n=1 Tax=Dothistroma septosporum (strain NZE10 / CBS 128990) TaxID=675120 RepID=N1PMI3_DOTSN|nr:hypothetical protein DOTSEDRAFT_71822 [Dothistroma septosporum NZE10]